ncbi:MAG: MBL fold metallo-hydrolase [Clostridia bacterium]|nr:MBL fold metallo-hydrolase [Clostridia bacterium]
MNRSFRSAVLILLVLVPALLFCACGTGTAGDPAAETLPYVNELLYALSGEEGEVDIVMFRVGRADAMLISTQNCKILLDTGEKDDQDADKIIEYLKAQNVTRLDAVIVSNVLTDNIGGFERISAEFEIGQVIEPSYNATGHRYTKFLRTVVQSGAALSSLSEVTSFTFDDVTFTCYPSANPLAYDTEEDMSLVVTMTHGENSLLLCGNIQEPRIPEVTATVTDTFDVVKLPDHGFWFDGVGAFLDQYQPAYVLISDSVTNEVSYDMLSLLAEKNITYYRTADAYVCIRSDGKRLEFGQY